MPQEKTAPGLRYFDKEAVEIGGGKKHRLRLDEMVMIKDNHIAVEKFNSRIINQKSKKKNIENLKLKLKILQMQFLLQKKVQQ